MCARHTATRTKTSNTHTHTYSQIFQTRLDVFAHLHFLIICALHLFKSYRPTWSCHLFMSCCCCSCSSFFNAHIQIHLHAYAAEKTNSNLHSYTICTLSGANLHMNVRVCVCKYLFGSVNTPAFECLFFARRAPYMLTQSC